MFNFLKDVASQMAPSTRSTSKSIKGYKICDNDRNKKFGIGANCLQVLKEKAFLKFPANVKVKVSKDKQNAHVPILNHTKENEALVAWFAKARKDIANFEDLHLYLSTDGSEVSDEDYFQSLPAQTLFVVDGPDAIITTDADWEFEKVRQQSPLLKVSDIVYEFMEKHPDKFRKMITEYERTRTTHPSFLKSPGENAKTSLSLKSEHREWFSGQEEKCHSKEEAMARRAQDRVRGYYYKTKDELTRNILYRQNADARKIIDSVLEKFRYLLIGCDYFSMMFNRKCSRKHEFIQDFEKDDETDASKQHPNKRLRQIIKDYTTRNEILDEWSVSLCTSLGDFYCQGTYSDNGNCCSLQHTINPYASRENLILFQVWNLDHQIELSRSILPALIENVRDLVTQPGKCKLHREKVVDISVLEYFLEIFSLKNLKLVHIVCHEKTQRSNKSNGRLICPQCHEFRIVKELMDASKLEELCA